MKIRRHLGTILLATCLSQALAISATATDTQPTPPNTSSNSMASKDDLSTQKELFQVQLDAKKELLQKDIEAQTKRIDAFEKRIDDQNSRISDIGSQIERFGILITVLFVVAGLLGYRTAKKDAKETAAQAAAEWFETNHNKLLSQMDELEKRVTQASQTIDGHTEEVAQKSSETQAMMKELEEKAQAQMQIIQNQMAQDRTTGKSEDHFPKDNSAIEQKSEQLKQKPESEYTFPDWNTRAFAAYSEGKLDYAIFYWDKAIGSFDIQPQAKAQALFNKGLTLGKLNREEEALEVYDSIIDQFSTAEELALREPVAKAMCNKGIALSRLNRIDEEIALYNAVITQFGTAEELSLREQIARVTVNKGVALGQLNRYEEAIVAYETVITQFSTSEELNLREQVARAMAFRGFTLDKLNRKEEAITVYDAVISEFGTIEKSSLREQVVDAMLRKGIILDQLNRKEEAIAAYDTLITNFGNTEQSNLRVPVANAMVRKGIILGELNHKEEAIAIYDAIITKIGTARELNLREQIAHAMVNKGFTLGQLNHIEEQIAVYDSVIAEFGAAEELTLREQVAAAMGNKGFALLCKAKANWMNIKLARELLENAYNTCNLATMKNSDNGFTYGNLAYITWLQGNTIAAEQHFKNGLAATTNGGESLYNATLTDFDIHPIEPDQGFKELVEKLWAEHQQSYSN